MIRQPHDNVQVAKSTNQTEKFGGLICSYVHQGDYIMQFVRKQRGVLCT
jgi:hypothetical protein